MLLPHARSEPIRHHVEVVHRKLIVKHIPVLLRWRRAAVLATSAVHSGDTGGGRGCVCAAAVAYTAPC
jgi:hypothetical protein